MQPELCRHSSLCCLASPGLGVSWEPPPSTHGRAWTGHLLLPVGGATGQKCLLLEVLLQECRAPAPSWVSGASQPLCSVPAIQCVLYSLSGPQSPHLCDQGRHPTSTLLYLRFLSLLGDAEKHLRGGTERNGNSVFPPRLCIRTRAAALLETEPEK